MDQEYFESTIEPMLSQPHVEFIGEIGEDEKQKFLGDALGLLFPIDWPEPFGLVMIEALACGTPVIAYPCGSVPEILAHGVTGFLVQSMEEAVGAVRSLASIERATCRRVFEERFTSDRMARDYVAAYERIIASTEGEPRLDPRAA